jgi:hypothetical protein
LPPGRAPISACRCSPAETPGLPAIAKAIREETQALDANVLIQSGSLEDNLALFQLPSRILSILAFTLGLAGLLLASLGIYRRDGSTP